ncbi:MAG TPA: SDR family NAD(P)-dependent oxidoreductase [Rhizomicrobium sp.]|jgi:NAD(P)-dependent dehydrogenase (short-subunit alcohol dehydrogenase family)
MDLKDRGCIVTGGFGALGAAVAQTLRERGAKVALIDRAESPHPLIPSPQGGGENVTSNAIAFGGIDLADPASAKRAIDEAASQLGGLYALVNVAGAFRWETVADGDVATWDFLYSVNLKTALCASKAALPHLVSGGTGRIVNIGAGAAAKASAGMGAYAASKAGVARLTEALSEEVKAKAITVNAVLPSIIDTPANRKDMPKADFAKWVTPDAIGGLIAFLLSDEAGAITGALIPISGRV